MMRRGVTCRHVVRLREERVELHHLADLALALAAAVADRGIAIDAMLDEYDRATERMARAAYGSAP